MHEVRNLSLAPDRVPKRVPKSYTEAKTHRRLHPQPSLIYKCADPCQGAGEHIYDTDDLYGTCKYSCAENRAPGNLRHAKSLVGQQSCAKIVHRAKHMWLPDPGFDEDYVDPNPDDRS
jgi:hypothetical protein